MSKGNQPSELDLRMSEMVIKDKGKHNIQKSDSDDKKDKDKKVPKCYENKKIEGICENFIKDINAFGISVMDGFLGQNRGESVLKEVLQLRKSGSFQEGQLVRNNTTNNSIRGDEILWLRGNEAEYPHIRKLIEDIDRVVITASNRPNNGKLGEYRICSRTRIMVACYPGNGAQYVKHVDNPEVDARIITAIYYLNKNWDREKHGGMLRIFPTDERTQVADIDPQFDRMLFFWSDRRNPHEVQPSFRTRYAITIWYYDSIKAEALKRRRLEPKPNEDQSNLKSKSS